MELADARGPGVGTRGDRRRARSRSRCAAAGPRSSTRLRAEVDLPTLYVPYLFSRSQGSRETRMVADALAEELGL